MAHFSETSLSQYLRGVLYVFGLWPKTTSHPLYQIYSYILHICTSYTFTLCLFINFFMNYKDTKLFMEAMYPTLTVLIYLVKLTNYYYNKDRIIECLTKLLRIQRNSRPDENIFRAKLEHLNKLTFFFYFSANSTVLAAAFKALIAKDWQLPIPIWYPIDWQHNQLNYWIAFTFNIMSTFVVGNINLTMDCYTFYLMGMITAQFQMLYNYIAELGTNIPENYDSKFSNELKNDAISLKLCLKEHQEIMELVSDVERYFSMQFLVQICLSGAMLSCGIYQLSEVSPWNNFSEFIFLVAFMTTITMQTFLYTYYGNDVLAASDSLSNAVYLSKWYMLLPALAKNVIIFMERLKRKRQILAGKLFPMHLIMDLAYRLYIFLKSV